MQPVKARAWIDCAPCGQRFEGATMEMAGFRFRDHLCPAMGSPPTPYIEPPPSDVDEYLERLRRVERVLDAGFHNPAHFVARIRAAIGVLP
jgi:hypothetical protein